MQKNQTPLSSNLFATTPASPFFSSISDQKKEPEKIGNAFTFPWQTPAGQPSQTTTSGFAYQDAKNITTAFDVKKDTAVPSTFSFGINNPLPPTTPMSTQFSFGVDNKNNMGSNIGTSTVGMPTPTPMLSNTLGMAAPPAAPPQGFNFNNPIPDNNPSPLLGNSVFTFSQVPSSTPSTQGRPAPKRFKSKTRKN
jgi:hypothetical protein